MDLGFLWHRAPDLPTDRTDTSPILLPLDDNGGPTVTHALDSTSPAVDAGDPWTVRATDQRGFPRRHDGDGDGTPTPDIGAYELLPGLIFFDGFESGDAAVWGV